MCLGFRSKKMDRTLEGHDKRPRNGNSWVGIVIHHTGIGNHKNPSESLWEKLYKNIGLYLAREDSNYVSSHYLVGRGGQITQIIDPYDFVAYHAGKSSFWHPLRREWVSGCNNHFIGIEILGDGNKQAYTTEQYSAVAKLSKELMKNFPTIQPNCIVGHEMVSPGRKNDPGIHFDWRYFYKLLYS